MNIENIRCPITKLIFKDPVSLPSGQTYERYAIQEWFTSNLNDPITREEFDDEPNLSTNITLKNIIEDHLQKHPSLYLEQYKGIYSHLKLMMKMTEEELKTVPIEIYEKLFEQLQNGDDDENENIIFELFKHDNIMKCIIDNFEFDVVVEEESDLKLIHCIFSFSSFEIIQYAIEKGLSSNNPVFEIKNNSNETPIDYLVTDSSFNTFKRVLEHYPELKVDNKLAWMLFCDGLEDIPDWSDKVAYVLNKGIDINKQDDDGRYLIHSIVRYCDLDLIKLAVAKGAIMNIDNCNGMRPVHIVCKCRSFEIIEYIFSLKINTYAKTNKGLTIKDFIKKNENLGLGYQSKELFVEFFNVLFDENDEVNDPVHIQISRLAKLFIFYMEVGHVPCIDQIDEDHQEISNEERGKVDTLNQ